MIVTDQDALVGEGQVLLGRGQWPCRGPALPRAGCTEWRDDLQGCSKTLTDQGVLAGEGQALLGRGQWPRQGPSSLQAGRNDHRDELQAESKRQFAWDGWMGKVPELHDQGR